MPSNSVRPLNDTLREYARGVAGGMIFSLAVLYTMEIWWQGYVVPPHRLLLGALLLFLVIFAFTYYIGMHADKSLGNTVLESFETIAIGTILAAVVLLLAGQLEPSHNLYELITMLAVEGGAAAIGVAVGTSQFPEKTEENGESSHDDRSSREGAETEENGSRVAEKEGSIAHELSFAVLGALIMTFGIGPTEEIELIAYDARPLWVLIALCLTLLATWGISSHSRMATHGRGSAFVAGNPLADAVVTYVIALLVCTVLRWLVGGLDSGGLEVIIAEIVFLAIPGAIGASAGRLLLR